MVEQYCVIYFGFLHIHQRNYLKLVWNCCDEFEQVNGGYMYPAALVSQFEIKVKCI